MPFLVAVIDVPGGFSLEAEAVALAPASVCVLVCGKWRACSSQRGERSESEGL